VSYRSKDETTGYRRISARAETIAITLACRDPYQPSAAASCRLRLLRR